MDEPLESRWGHWILARSRFVGFQRQSDLADAVGCRREQINRWVNLKRPPTQMRKGFDQKLAYALETTRSMLFTEWRGTPPEKAHRERLYADQFALDDFKFWPGELPIETTLRKFIRLLAPSEAEQLLYRAALLVIDSGANSKRTMVAREVVNQYKMMEHCTKTGKRVPALPSTPPPFPNASRPGPILPPPPLRSHPRSSAPPPPAPPPSPAHPKKPSRKL